MSADELEVTIVEGVVEVRGGRLRGVRRQGVWSFSGIPYAASPAGPRRWQPPGPPPGWTGVRECDRFGPIAPQSPGMVELSIGGDHEEQSEDCLSLNVWTPGLDAGRRPVMVWVHGGSFASGSGSSGLYRGGMLARDGEVVVVTFNYRLGILGFLAHPALEEPGQCLPGGEPWTGFGNWGLADQIAVLHWVRDHIASFGGDPGCVTLFGESAGGMSISALMAAPAARGLFHRAIVESGPPYTFTADRASARAEQLAAHLGVPMTREAMAKVPADDLVRCAAEFGQLAARTDDSTLLLMPVVDGALVSADPTDEVASGSSSRVPLLIGTTRDESSFFTVGNATLRSLDEDGLMRWMRRLIPEPEVATDLVETVRAARAQRGEPVGPRDLWVAISTEYVFRLPTVRFADAHAAAAAATGGPGPAGGTGAAGGSGGPGAAGVGTYCYLFTWESPAFGGYLGSCHALDLPFVFGTVHNPAVQGFSGAGDDAFALSAAIREAWTAFAHRASPGGWPLWNAERRPTTVLGPWPAEAGVEHYVDRPRNEELEAVAAAAVPRVAT